MHGDGWVAGWGPHLFPLIKNPKVISPAVWPLRSLPAAERTGWFFSPRTFLPMFTWLFRGREAQLLLLLCVCCCVVLCVRACVRAAHPSWPPLVPLPVL